METTIRPIDEAFSRVGGQSKLGALIGRRQSTVSYWAKTGRVAPESVLDVERVTGVSRHLLRPDLYPVPTEPSSPFPAEADA